MKNDKRDPRAKIAHIEAALNYSSERNQRPGLKFSDLRFLPNALPEVDLHSIDLTTYIVGKKISSPIMIAPMTGGVEKGAKLNRILAEAAEQIQCAMGVGSQRVALEDPKRMADFQLRSIAKNIPIFGNIGGVQLIQGVTPEKAAYLVEAIQADALFIHLNAMQEFVQEKGDVEWQGVTASIGQLIEFFKKRNLPPIFVREVGFGFSSATVQKLVQLGVDGIDCAGGGGTSWTWIEGHVAKDDLHKHLGTAFQDWGLTTPESILEVRKVDQGLFLIASGGLRSGIDLAKAIALGAHLGAFAAPLARAAEQKTARAGVKAVLERLQQFEQELKGVLFGLGLRKPEQLKRKHLINHHG